MASTFTRLTLRQTPRNLFTPPQTRALSRLTVIGRLGGPPTLSPTSTGTDLIKYSVATTSMSSPPGADGQRPTSWFRISYFPGSGEYAQRRKERVLGLEKGTLVAVEGDVSVASWEAEDGSKRTGWNVVQRSLEVLRAPAVREGEGAEEVEEGEVAASA